MPTITDYWQTRYRSPTSVTAAILCRSRLRTGRTAHLGRGNEEVEVYGVADRCGVEGRGMRARRWRRFCASTLISRSSSRGC